MALTETKVNASEDRATAQPARDAMLTEPYDDVPSAVQVEEVLEIPASALVDKAQVVVLALPAGRCLISQAAEIRPDKTSNHKAIIDLKRMRSVSGISASQAVKAIKTWTGAEFSSSEITTTTFSEIATEKLLVEFTENFKVADLTENGRIWLPDPPTDLILTVNGKTVWTHIGPVKLSSGSFEQSVDISETLQEEINSGKTAFTVQLRAAFSCKMQLTVTGPDYRLSHEVIFPAQALALEVNEECLTTISLPLPASSSGWRTEEVALTVAGDSGQARIFPAVGPQPLALGELLIASDHALAASLSAAELNNFSLLEGVRLPLKVEEGGAEITARLRADNSGRPGDVIGETNFQSLSLDAVMEEKWFLLELTPPYDLAGPEELWLEINAIRGRCWWALGEKKEGGSAGVVSLRRGVPGGPFSPFNINLAHNIPEFYGRLRLKGRPVVAGGIPAIMVLHPENGLEVSGISTGRSPVDVVLRFAETVQPVSGKLDLPLMIHAPGSYTFSKAKIIYKT